MVVNITCITSLVYEPGAFTISILQMFTDLILEQFYNEDTVIITVLQMRKLSHREVNEYNLAQICRVLIRFLIMLG